MALGDLYQIVVQTNFKTKAIGQNVFFYMQLSGTANPAQALADNFGAGVASQMRNIMTNDVVFESVKVTNLYNKAQVGLYAFPVNTAGTRPGTSEPPFVASVFRVQRTRADMRDGYKRFWGVAESDVEDGLLTNPLPSVYVLLQSAIRANIITTGADAAEFFPVIVKRIREGTTPPYSYRLPANVSEYQGYQIGTNGNFIQAVSTQNSRKFGRGI